MLPLWAYMDIKIVIVLGMIGFSTVARGECITRGGVSGQLELRDSEFAYEVRTYGAGFRDYTGEVIEQIERALTEARIKVEHLSSDAIDGKNEAAKQAELMTEIGAKSELIFKLKWAERMYSLPVEKIIKGAEKSILEIKQASVGDSTGFEKGGRYLVIVDAKQPYNPVSRCLIIKIGDERR